MILPSCETWQLGKYTVRAAVRIDNPLFSRYVVMRGGKVVGCSFSRPNAAQCEDIERFAQTGRYADAPIQTYNYRLRGVARGRTGRPTNAARAKAAAELLTIADGW